MGELLLVCLAFGYQTGGGEGRKRGEEESRRVYGTRRAAAAAAARCPEVKRDSEKGLRYLNEDADDEHKELDLHNINKLLRQ